MFGGRIFRAASASIGLIFGACAEPEHQITSADGSDMIYIPGGEFFMGSAESDLEGLPDPNHAFFISEKPLHRVNISPFYLDRFEVTNAQYVEFFTAFNTAQDSSLLHPDHPDGLGLESKHVSPALITNDRQPVVSATWFAAYSYCRWAGKRLPTEAEWEYAARGGDGHYRKYPWGNTEPDADVVWPVNYSPPDGPDMDGISVTAPVGSYPDGVSYFGIMDMAGNAQEWVADWFAEDYYSQSDGARDPTGPVEGGYKVRKGGSYRSNRYHIRIASRAYGRAHHSTAAVGIRCARDP